MKNRKVVLIGCGAVGTSFLYSALNQNLFDEYVLIDAFENLSKGNAMDFEDASVMMTTPCRNVKQGNYDDCSDADIIVITAGVPQKPGETRIELIGRNAKIIEDIATNVKDSGFEGITVIASNPVDIIGTIYQRITGFDIHKVIPSGTSLDSARFRYILADKLNINAASINTNQLQPDGAIDLKLGRFKPEHEGQMLLYLRYLNRNERKEGEEAPIGLILCSEGNTEHIEYLMLEEDSPVKVAQYYTKLPDKKLLSEKLQRAIAIAKEYHRNRDGDDGI